MNHKANTPPAKGNTLQLHQVKTENKPRAGRQLGGQSACCSIVRTRVWVPMASIIYTHLPVLEAQRQEDPWAPDSVKGMVSKLRPARWPRGVKALPETDPRNPYTSGWRTRTPKSCPLRHSQHTMHMYTYNNNNTQGWTIEEIPKATPGLHT